MATSRKKRKLRTRRAELAYRKALTKRRISKLGRVKRMESGLFATK